MRNRRFPRRPKAGQLCRGSSSSWRFQNAGAFLLLSVTFGQGAAPQPLLRLQLRKENTSQPPQVLVMPHHKPVIYSLPLLKSSGRADYTRFY